MRIRSTATEAPQPCRRAVRARFLVYVALPLFLSATGTHCPFGNTKEARGFTKINRNGFGYLENLVDMNDYPWGLQYFQPDGSETGFIYCSTGNGIDDQILYQIGQLKLPIPPLRPGEVRRYRLDVGNRVWQSSLDIRDFEDGPEFQTTGFRSLRVYKPENMPNYLYAGSLSADAALWRSASGEPGDWEKIWSYGDRGSIRAAAVHNGLLYFAVLPGGEIGTGRGVHICPRRRKYWQVVGDGFGDQPTAAFGRWPPSTAISTFPSRTSSRVSRSGKWKAKATRPALRCAY